MAKHFLCRVSNMNRNRKMVPAAEQGKAWDSGAHTVPLLPNSSIPFNL